MKTFVQVMASSFGRVLRIVAGLALIGGGLFVVSGTTGLVMAVVGLVPLLAGLLDFCVFAPLFGQPLKGARIRANQ